MLLAMVSEFIAFANVCRIFARDSIGLYAIARICDRNSGRTDVWTDVWTDVRHTGGLYKNG